MSEREAAAEALTIILLGQEDALAELDVVHKAQLQQVRTTHNAERAKIRRRFAEQIQGAKKKLRATSEANNEPVSPETTGTPAGDADSE